ncbi:hypothetical protein FGB62_107g014 [Gracilaria domingensis]|nr:hypothetical protein FGB62_107g014 [Gracilaria domingensis]
MPPSILVLLILHLTFIVCNGIERDSDPSVWDLIRGHGDDAVNRFDTDPWDFDVFRSLVETVPAVKSILDTQTITVFLPNDLGCSQTANDVIALADNSSFVISDVNTEQHAFYSLQTNWLQRFENATQALELWLKYHIVPGAYSFQDILELGSFKFSTFAEQNLDLVVTRLSHKDPRFPYAEIAFAPPSQPTIQPRNGFVVAVDRMLFPSFSSLSLNSNAQQAFPSASSSVSAAPSRSISPSSSPTPRPSKSKKPSPSTAPVPTPEPAGACFSSSSTVRMRNGTSLPLSRLKAGHEVLVSEKAISKVFLFTHKEVHGVYNFIEITSDDNQTITLTPGHYIYANNQRVAAYVVREGDMLRTVEGPSRVRTLRYVKSRGLVAPHTLHGDIVVNGIIASTYTMALNPILAHSALTPLRYLVKVKLSVEPLRGLLYYGISPRIASWLPSGRSFS